MPIDSELPLLVQPKSWAETADPKPLYRFLNFTGWENGPSNTYRYKDFLGLGKMHFSNPARFNDPFDSLPSFEEQLSALREHLVTREYAFTPMLDNQVTPAEAAKTLARMRHEVNKKLISKHPEYLESYRRDVVQLHRMVCLTKNLNSNLMWSHYANYHQGYAVRLNRESSAIQKIAGTTFPVEYLPVRPSVNLSVLDLRYALTKAPEWTYEAEWRVIVPADELESDKAGDCFFQLDPDAVSEIYLGWRFDPAQRTEELSFLTKYFCNARLFKMYPDRINYDLHPEPFTMTR